MQASADSLAFAPPPEPAAVRAFVLAVLAHLILLAALTWGINWQKEPTIAAEAELWSRIPEQAAPPPAPVVPPPPQPVTPPAVQQPVPPVTKEPDIVQEREKKQREEEARRQREEEERKALEAKKKQQQEEAARREQAAKEKAAEERKKQEQLAKAEKDKKAAEDKKLAQLREENMRRMQGLAGSTGTPDSRGTNQRTTGPTESYGGRIKARVKPNIVFSDNVPGNPSAEVEVRMAPDGTITGKRVVKPSGSPSWDEAVLRALDKTEVLPRDTDGRVHSPLIITFRPKD